jgi:hypothetical protein
LPQAFRPAHVLFLKLAAIGFAILTVTGAVVWRTATGPVASREDPVEQPIPFSHQHHVRDDGIDCRFCHTSVEQSGSAGMPTTEVCLTCHSQLFRDAPVLAPLHESLRTQRPIAWQRVHDLPDFAYFNHSIHVAKGVGCTTCHGAVDEMPLMRRVQSLEMQWCLDCHRHPEQHVRPRESVFDPQWTPDPKRQVAAGMTLVHDYGIRVGHLTNCSDCHR